MGPRKVEGARPRTTSFYGSNPGPVLNLKGMDPVRAGRERRRGDDFLEMPEGKVHSLERCDYIDIWRCIIAKGVTISG